MRMLFRYLRPYLTLMTSSISMKFIGSLVELLIPYVLSYIIDDVVPKKSVPQITFWGGIMLLCAIIALVTNILANRMAAKVARNTTQAIRHDLFSKISYLSCRQIDEFSIPSLEARLTTDTYYIHQFIGTMQRLGIRAPILLLGGIVVTLTLDPVLALVLIATLPLIGGLTFYISRKGIPLYTRTQNAVDVLVRTVRENITGIRVTKALSKTEYEKDRFAGVNAEVVRREKKAGMTMALTNPLMNLFLNLGLTGVILVGAYRVNAGTSQTGAIIAFLTYFTIILNAMLSITRMFNIYSRGSASASRVSKVLEAPEEMAAERLPKTEASCHVAFDHVTFSYLKGEHNLEDISFSLKKGETLGILGATGSGKSTLIHLLMRLYDPDKGEIRIQGENIRSIPPEKLHTMFGIVFQNDILFADTIAANIDFGRGLPREWIEKAAEDAQAMEFIHGLADGFDHMLTPKGTNLSGGQKQRLLVARALAGKPEILVLDDSSSALDYKTDSQLRQALSKDFGGTTTIIVAQRISSLKHADHILVLDEGKTLGYGTHEELLKSCKIYRQISQSQMGGDSVA